MTVTDAAIRACVHLRHQLNAAGAELEEMKRERDLLLFLLERLLDG